VPLAFCRFTHMHAVQASEYWRPQADLAVLPSRKVMPGRPCRRKGYAARKAAVTAPNMSGRSLRRPPIHHGRPAAALWSCAQHEQVSGRLRAFPSAALTSTVYAPASFGRALRR